MHILICDDSGMARKQMLRALPAQISDNIEFAENGQQAIDKLTSSHFDLLLLDLTMPIMDGYETLNQIQQQNIDCMTIVVSGDIQAQAQQRVMSLGALAFLKKPVDAPALHQLLTQYGLITRPGLEEQQKQTDPRLEAAATNFHRESARDCLREIANIAMGRAADKLSSLLGAFINLPIPRVEVLTKGELAMTLAALADGQHIAVGQGFAGHGLTAEALLSTDLHGRDGLKKLMSSQNQTGDDSGISSVLDASAILTGAFLIGIGDILDLEFSKSQPVFLSSTHYSASDWDERIQNTSDTLTIEIPYHFEKEDFICDLLLLFPGKAGDYILERSSYLIDEV